MAHFRYLVYTNPVEGLEAEYNDWYDNTHLGEVIAVPGFIAAERYELQAEGDAKPEHRFLAIYEFEADDPATVLAELAARAGDGRINMKPVLAPGIKTHIYKVITPRVTN